MDWKSPRMWLQIVLCCIVKITFAQEFFFQESSYTASEADQLLTIGIERTGPLNNLATVDITSSGDIQLGISQIEFLVGVSYFYAGIVLVDDQIASPDRSAILTLSNPSEGSIGSPSSTTVTVTDNDGSGGPAPGPAQWSEWEASGSCSVTCGTGTQTRTRTCSDPDSSACPGSSQDTAVCDTEVICPVTPTWNPWGPYSSCSASCEGGTQTRTRTCNDPDTTDNVDCTPGSSQDSQSCNTQACEITDPYWSSWGAYTTCTVSCGGGTQTRTRVCNHPDGSDGIDCNGESTQQQTCNTQICPAWSAWGPWNTCSVTCDHGIQTRTRTCTNSQICPGSASDTQTCYRESCPVWNDWGSWSQCSQTCGGGTHRRTRTCDNLNFGNVASCQGPSTEEDQCNTQRCPDYCSSETEKTPYGSISTPDNQPVGATYISDEVCPWYTRYENNPIARVHCVQGNNMAHWNWDIDCGGNKTAQEIFEILSNQPITEDNVESTLQMTEDLTGHANDIQAEDVSLVTDILRNVVNLKTPKREVTDVVVTIVSNLMDVEASVITQAQMMDGSPSDAVEIFEEQLQVVQIHREDIGAWPYRRVTRNVAAEVFEASDDVFNNGIYAASDSRSTNTLLTLERQASTNLDVEIEIPKETFENQQQRVAIDVLASNRLLTSTRLQDQNSLQTNFKTVTNSRVISATVGDQKISDLDKPIRMTYRPLELHANNTQCVFWDFPRNDWSTDGCRYLGETPEWMVICECNHLTNFAILMDIYGGSTLTKTQDFILEILTYVGCVLSILGLAVTLLTYCTSRKLKSKRPNQILINLSSALLGLYVVFVILLSIDTGRDQTELEAVACSILAGVLHYFTLASLFWMAVEGFNMYLMFIKVINSYIPSLLLKASLFAWGVPFLIVAVTAGIARGGYARSDFCFLEKWPLVGGVLVPIGLILLFNITIFVFVMMKLSRESPASKLQQKRKGLKMRRLRNAICIMTLMGLTWVIGYLSIIKAASFFSQLIFCLLNAMQGYAIFMLYCVQQADVRNSWREVCGTIRRRPQSSLSSSRARGTSGGEFISSNRRSGSSSADDAALLNGNNTSF